jgi:hypothetical protein
MNCPHFLSSIKGQKRAKATTPAKPKAKVPASLRLPPDVSPVGDAVGVRVILAVMLRVRLPVIPPVILPVGPLLADVSVVVDPALSLEVAGLSPEDAELSAAATVNNTLTVGNILVLASVAIVLEGILLAAISLGRRTSHRRSEQQVLPQ